MNGFHDYEVKLELAIWCWNKPSLINKHSGKATHDLTNHLKAKNMSEKAGLLVSYYFEFK